MNFQDGDADMVDVLVRRGREEKIIRKRSAPTLGTWILFKGGWWYVLDVSWKL